MPYRIEFENKHHGVVLTFEGVVNGDEVLDAFKEVHKTNKSCQLRYQVWDTTRVKSLFMPEGQLRHMAILESGIAKTNPHQFVVLIGKQEILLGIDVRYNVYAKVWSAFVGVTVHTRSQARELLKKSMELGSSWKMRQNIDLL